MPDRIIHILPEQVASQIAAGEVVERPASAVKELVENSLDAGARTITVEIAGGGTGLLAVTDDGCGMGAHDALLAIRRHATSKIRDAADLVGIRSLGFRGEALAAIASVARVELKTRPADELSALHLSVVGGEVRERRECALAPGTRIEARELFFNTPARLKFLKTPATEQANVVEVLQRQALSHPELAFYLYADGRQVLDLPPAASLLERFRQLFGSRVAVRMIPVTGGSDGVRVEGLLSASQESFPTGRMMHTYINRRAVRDRLLMRAASNAYATLLPRGRFPAVVLFLTLGAQEVDVNVHPMKAEVRFRRSGPVFEAVYRTLRDRLANQSEGVAPESIGPGAPLPGPRPHPESESAPPVALAAARPLRLVMEQPIIAPRQVSLGLGWRPAAELDGGLPGGAEAPASATETALPTYSGLRVLGQLFTGYITLESDDGLLLVDQHAAHERVTFEKLKAQLKAGTVEVQTELMAQTLELNPARAAHVSAALPQLRALGFDLELFGPTTLVLKGTPAVFGARRGLPLLANMVDSIGEGGSFEGEAGFESLLKQLACHGSVRVGRVLAPEEMKALLAELDRTPFRSNCPHGRPVHIRFGRGQIERMFRR